MTFEEMAEQAAINVKQIELLADVAGKDSCDELLESLEDLTYGGDTGNGLTFFSEAADLLCNHRDLIIEMIEAEEVTARRDGYTSLIRRIYRYLTRYDSNYCTVADIYKVLYTTAEGVGARDCIAWHLYLGWWEEVVGILATDYETELEEADECLNY